MKNAATHPAFFAAAAATGQNRSPRADLEDAGTKPAAAAMDFSII
jgi:hypothetical protein